MSRTEGNNSSCGATESVRRNQAAKCILNENALRSPQYLDRDIMKVEMRSMSQYETVGKCFGTTDPNLQGSTAIPRTAPSSRTNFRVGWAQPGLSQQSYIVSAQHGPWYPEPTALFDPDPALQLGSQGSVEEMRHSALGAHVSPQRLSRRIEDVHGAAWDSNIEWRRLLGEDYPQVPRPDCQPETPRGDIPISTRRSGTQGPDRAMRTENVHTNFQHVLSSSEKDGATTWPADPGFGGNDNHMSQDLAGPTTVNTAYQQDMGDSSWNLGFGTCCGLPAPVESTLALMNQEACSADWWKMLESDGVLLPDCNVDADLAQQIVNASHAPVTVNEQGTSTDLLDSPEFWLSPISCSSQAVTPEPPYSTTQQMLWYSSETNDRRPLYNLRTDPKRTFDQAGVHPLPQERTVRQPDTPVGVHRSYRVNKPHKPKTKVLHRSVSKDDFLIRSKAAGLSYKEIKLKGRFQEAESTLRGRYRTLTKRKEQRVRRPEWQHQDVSSFLHIPEKVSLDELRSDAD